MTDNNLTIRFTPDGFSFADEDVIEIAPGQDFIQRMEEALLEHVQPGHQTTLRCEIETTRLLLVPSDIEEEQTIREMFSVTLSPASHEEELLTQVITLPRTGQTLKLCFAIDRNLYNFLIRNYGELSFSHPISSMLADADRMTQGNCLVVRSTKQFLEVALFRGNRLMLCNCYQTTQADTRSYYVMNTWLQQELDQLQDYLLVLGQGNEGLQIRASLHRFIKHVFS